jgi:hypothetical protein
MGMRLGSAHGLGAHTWRLLIPALAVALLMALGATSASAARSATCSITNKDSARTYTRLQQAVDAAKPGARLVIEGTCQGGTFIDKDLVIIGKRTERTGKPVLDGDGDVRVLVIKPGANVNLRSLYIREGWWIRGHGTLRVSRGGGISNKGTVTLQDVAVRNGGGIHNAGTLRIRGRAVASGLHNSGRLVLAGGSRVNLQADGGGVSNEGDLLMEGSSLYGKPDGSFTTGFSNTGTLTMDGASSSSGFGGVGNAGTLTMNDESSIHDNHWRQGRGPVGMVVPAPPGGGVMNRGTLTMNDASSIYRNSTVGVAGTGLGGGVYNAGHLTMSGSSRITGNRAGLGGGLYDATGGILVGVICGPGGNVYGNTPDDCYVEP